jgi:hypothetical protein
MKVELCFNYWPETPQLQRVKIKINDEVIDIGLIDTRELQDIGISVCKILTEARIIKEIGKL